MDAFAAVPDSAPTNDGKLPDKIACVSLFRPDELSPRQRNADCKWRPDTHQVKRVRVLRPVVLLWKADSRAQSAFLTLREAGLTDSKLD